MPSPIALVTGANKGLGLEIARQLAQSGALVLLGARDAERGREAAKTLQSEGLEVRVLALDVTDAASIEAAAMQIESEFGLLDILVNNAGVALEMTSPSGASLDAIRQTFETNVFGVVALTQALLPLLKKSEHARIVNMSSELGSLSLMGDSQWEFYSINAFAYCASKTALNAFTVGLAKELADTNVKVNSVTPGYTATDLNNFQGTRTIEEGAREPVRVALLGKDSPTGQFFEEHGPMPW